MQLIYFCLDVTNPQVSSVNAGKNDSKWIYLFLFVCLFGFFFFLLHHFHDESHCSPFLTIISMSASGNKLSFCQNSHWHPHKIKGQSTSRALCKRGHSVKQTVLQSLVCSTSVQSVGTLDVAGQPAKALIITWPQEEWGHLHLVSFFLYI